MPKPFEARHDWEIVCDFGRRLERKLDPGVSNPAPEGTPRRDDSHPGEGRDPIRSLLPYGTPESIWNEHRESTRGRDLDITGLTYSILDHQGPQHWPYPSGAPQGEARLYADGVFPTANGRARFFAESHKPVAEPVDARYPLRLNTGRMRDHWHAMSRTGNVASLFGHVPEPRVALHPNDLARRGLRAGDIVRVQSRRGAIHVIAEADESVRSGQAYLPMHWGKRFLGGRESAGVNTVTLSTFDPVSKQPELKHAAVKVSAVDLPWRLVAFAECHASQVSMTLDAVQGLQDEVTFASTVLIGRDRPGVLFRAAHAEAPPAEWIAALDLLLGLDAQDVLRYEDARLNHSRRIRIVDDRLAAVRLTGTPNAITSGEWLRDYLVSGHSIAEVRRLLLSPSTRAPSGFVLSGRVVCQCWNVTEQEILAALPECAGEPRERLMALQEQLKCGSNCGSCAPDLRSLAEKVPAKSPRMVA